LIPVHDHHRTSCKHELGPYHATSRTQWSSWHKLGATITLACYILQTMYSLMKYDTKLISSDGYELFLYKNISTNLSERNHSG